jgi:hypothetical protein
MFRVGIVENKRIVGRRCRQQWEEFCAETVEMFAVLASWPSVACSAGLAVLRQRPPPFVATGRQHIPNPLLSRIRRPGVRRCCLSMSQISGVVFRSA